MVTTGRPVDVGYWNALAVSQFRELVSFRALDALREMALVCFDDETKGHPARIYTAGQVALAIRLGWIPLDANRRQRHAAVERMSRLFRELRDAKAIEQVKHHAPGSTAHWRLLLDVPEKGKRGRSTVVRNPQLFDG